MSEEQGANETDILQLWQSPARDNMSEEQGANETDIFQFWQSPAKDNKSEEQGTKETEKLRIRQSPAKDNKSEEQTEEHLQSVSLSSENDNCIDDTYWADPNEENLQNNINNDGIMDRQRYERMVNAERAREKINMVSRASLKRTQKQSDWTIKKILTKTDVSDTQLRLITKSAEENILRYLFEDDKKKLKDRGGAKVNVYDQDTATEHKLCLEHRGSYYLRSDYVNNGHWMNDFIKRRNLKQGDEIGLSWDESASRLNFCVFPPAEETKPLALILQEGPRY